MTTEYPHEKVAVLGYGQEGPAAYRYWTALGAEVTIHDQNPELKLPAGVKSALGKGYLDNLDSYDLIVRSPGIFPYRFKTTKPVTSVTNEFMARCRAKIIGVTGSKGKGTTASLIHHILEVSGQRAYLAGNIGVDPLQFLTKLTPNDYVVLELSNLQLWDIKHSPQIAVLLVIAPEHLDWHRGSMSEYVATKANITAHQKPGDSLVFDGVNPYTTQIAAQSVAHKLPFYTRPLEADLPVKAVWVDKQDRILMAQTYICDVSDVTLIGRHNLANVCAAIGATFGLVKDPRLIQTAIKTYKPLAHRLEYVGKSRGVKYYDDSIATHPLAAIGAIEAFAKPKVVILGGASKGEADFKDLAEAVAKADIRGVIAVGQTAAQIIKDLRASGYSGPIKTGLKTMPKIIKSAAQLTRPGDVVLLSPACASFGLFANYADRGDQFKAEVKRLKLEA